MDVRIWRSFACNNSSSAFLVARFADPVTAEDVGRELEAFFATHAEQIDATWDDYEGCWSEEVPPVAHELAAKYGFAWKEQLFWSTSEQVGDEPFVRPIGNAVVLYHWQMGAGFGDDLASYFAARGAIPTGDAPLCVSVVFTSAPDVAKALDEAFTSPAPELPWGDAPIDPADAAFFYDGETCGFHIPLEVEEIDPLREYLTANLGTEFQLRACDPDDLARFRAIARAVCIECSGAVRYLAADKHDLESDQLACPSCGGMFELDLSSGASSSS